MKIKICVSAFLFLVVLLVQNLWLIGIQPEVTAELALEQFQNPSFQTDTALRSVNRLGDYFPLLYVVWGGFTALLFNKEIKGILAKD